MRILVLAVLFCVAGCSQQPAAPAAPPGMVLVPGGTFAMGSDDGRPDEKPIHQVKLSAFYLDIHEVTNAQFADFVASTRYKTIAELPPNPKDFPGVPKSRLVPGAGVFKTPEGWSYVPGADWRHPSGPKSSIQGKENDPVVQVAWEDAVAYCKWAGKRLPTEAEWERAARGGIEGQTYQWGAIFDESKPQANFWQGSFPTKNDNTDGFLGLSPVQSFPANQYGLYDMAGNVWEWCSDWYRPDAYAKSGETNPKGPADSEDPNEPGVPKKVVRGGSYLCADCYCRGYRIASRMKSSPDTGLCHTGFRCAKDLP